MALLTATSVCMAGAYSMDLRLRQLLDADAGLPSKELAARYPVNRVWVDALRQRRRETGTRLPAGKHAATTLRPGYVVTLDHLGVSRGTDIPASVEAVGTTLHGLLANSPDVNPIELCFAKLKAILRAARPRAFDAVCDAVAASLGGFLAIECTHDVRHCG